MSDLRTRIAAVLRSALLEIGDYSSAETSADGEQWVFIDGTVMPDDLADAVIREVLTPEFLADLIIQTIQKAADDERIDDR